MSVQWPALHTALSAITSQRLTSLIQKTSIITNITDVSSIILISRGMGIVTLDMKASCFQLAGRLAQKCLTVSQGKIHHNESHDSHFASSVYTGLMRE